MRQVEAAVPLMKISQTLALHETQMLRDAAELVDERLARLNRDIRGCEDPDSRGLLDAWEYLTGFGFVACQTFLTATSNYGKRSRYEALELGPRHVCGETMAALVDAAANHWKHHTERDYQNLHKRARSIITRLERLGVVANDFGHYPVGTAHVKLLATREATFGNLVPFLERWRDELWG